MRVTAEVSHATKGWLKAVDSRTPPKSVTLEISQEFKDWLNEDVPRIALNITVTLDTSHASKGRLKDSLVPHLV